MLVKTTAAPGFVTETSNYTSGPTWVDGDKVRFRYGYPQKIGGWTKYIESTVIGGTARNIHAWRELDGQRDLAVGTECYLNLVQGGTISDITPIRATGTLGSDPFTTVISTSTVTVSHTSHGMVTNDRAIFSGAATFNGVTVDGTYTVTKVDDDNYTITVTDTASASGSGGGASVSYSYTINCGVADATYSYGWGTGTYGSSTYGTARTTSTTTLDLHLWSLDNWGEDLIAGVRNGGLYVWDSSSGVGTRATLIANAPSQIGLSMVSTPDRHAVVFGSHDGSAYDPLRVAWSDQEDYDTWTAAADNTAGSQRLAAGNKIVSAKKAKNQIMVWTDTDLYGMQFIGPPYTFGFQHLGTNCGALGPNAAVTYESWSFWMGCNNFYIYDGTIKVIDCPVRNYVFNDMNSVQQDKIFAGLNKEFNEVWWFYPSAASTEPDRYVIYNYKDNNWAYGTLNRSVWLDRGIWQYPIAIDHTNDTFYYHEFGSDAEEAAMSAYIETGSFEPGEGDTLSLMQRLIPDTEMTDSDYTMKVTVYSRRYPNSSDITKGPFSTTSATEKVSMRARGREYRFRYESDDLGNDWKLGTWRADIRPDGRR